MSGESRKIGKSGPPIQMAPKKDDDKAPSKTGPQKSESRYSLSKQFRGEIIRVAIAKGLDRFRFRRRQQLDISAIPTNATKRQLQSMGARKTDTHAVLRDLVGQKLSLKASFVRFESPVKIKPKATDILTRDPSVLTLRLSEVDLHIPKTDTAPEEVAGWADLLPDDMMVKPIAFLDNIKLDGDVYSGFIIPRLDPDEWFRTADMTMEDFKKAKPLSKEAAKRAGQDMRRITYSLRKRGIAFQNTMPFVINKKTGQVLLHHPIGMASFDADRINDEGTATEEESDLRLPFRRNLALVNLDDPVVPTWIKWNPELVGRLQTFEISHEKTWDYLLRRAGGFNDSMFLDDAELVNRMIEFLTDDVMDALSMVQFHPYTICRMISPERMGETYAKLCTYKGGQEGLSELVKAEVALQLASLEGEALNPRIMKLIGAAMEDYLEDHSADPDTAQYLSKKMIPSFLSKIRSEARKDIAPNFIRSRVKKTVRLYVMHCPLDISYPRILGHQTPEFIDDTLEIAYREEGDPVFMRAAQEFIQSLGNYNDTGSGAAGGGSGAIAGDLFRKITGGNTDPNGMTNRPVVSNLDPLQGFMIGWFGRGRPTFKA